MIKNQITFILIIIALLSCDSGNHTRTYHLPKAKNKRFIQPAVENKKELSRFKWEKPDLWIWLGGTVVFFAVVYITYRESIRKKKTEEKISYIRPGIDS